MTLRQQLRAWRKARDLTVRDAAALLGVSARTLEGIEQGRPFRFEKLLLMAIKLA